MPRKSTGPPKRTSEAAQECLRLLRVVFPLLVAPLCLTSLSYTILYAYIYARENSYGAENWEKCLTVPNIGNLHMDSNRFCTSASNFAGQAYLSLLVGVMGLHVGLRDNDLLPFSAFTCLVALVGILVFRESYPYFLDPNYMSTTLVTLSKYIQPHMYDDLAANTHLPKELKDKIPSTEVCRTAYHVNLAFLAVQYGVLALAVLISIMCAYAWWRRPRRGGPRVYLPGRELLVAFACTAFFGMLVMLVSKELAADVAIQVAQNDAHNTNYVFEDNNLDIVSFTTLFAIGVAIYVVCKPSLVGLTLCAGVGFINATRTVPGMLGTMAGYSGIYYPTIEPGGDDGDRPKVTEAYYYLWDLGSCADYVIATNPGAFTLDPSAEANARSICRYFRSSIGGQLLTWASILSLAVTALLILRRNGDVDERREAEQEARWARQRGLLPANPSTATADYDSDGSSGSGNSSDGGDCKGARQQRRTTGRGAPFYHRLYFSSAAVAPPAPLPTQHDGREKGELRHPLLGRDQLSAVQEGEGEEEAEWAEAKDAMDARDLGAALAARV